MKAKIITIAFIISLLTFAICHAQSKEEKGKDYPVLKGPYLGQKPPGMEVEVFAPGIISSKGKSELDCVFWPDGEMCIFSRFGEGLEERTIYETKVENGVWTKPGKSSIFSNFHCTEPGLSPDGKKIFFTSFSLKPPPGAEKSHVYLWFIQKTESGWSKPEYFGPGLYPSVTNDGTVYFTVGYRNGDHIARRKYVNNEYQPIEIVALSNIYQHEDMHPFIAPDESYLIFDSSTRPRESECRLFICFRMENGNWTEPKSMDKKIKIRSGMARVTFDGKYLFFHDSACDICWVDVKIIEELKPKELK